MITRTNWDEIEFIRICILVFCGLFADAVVAIGGSKFKAVSNRERNFAMGKIDRRERKLEKRNQRYLKP